MVLKIVLFICFFPVLPILYGLLRNETKPKKNIVLGVTLPYEARRDERVLRVCADFRRRLLIVTLLLAGVLMASLAIPSLSVAFTVEMTWLLVVIAAPYAVYVRAHKRLRRLKRDNAWAEGTAPLATVDLQVAARPPKRLSVGWFLPPILLSLIPVAVTGLTQRGGAAFAWMLAGYGTNALLTACFGVFHRIIYRQRSEVVDDNSDLSAVLTQVRRYNWSKCCLTAAWLTGIYSLLFWLTIQHPVALLVVTALYTVALLYSVLRVEFITRGAQQRLTADSGQGYYTDDDAHWIYGLFYYNPHDRHVMVNHRVGMGTAMNLARPVGKATILLSLLLTISLPFVGIWMMAEEFTPIDGAVENGRLVMTHTGVVMDIDLSAVTAVQCLDTLPPCRKIVGTGMDTLLKGSFDVEGYGTSVLCLNPQTAPFLVLRTGEGTAIIGTEDEASTAMLYDRLTALIIESE